MSFITLTTDFGIKDGNVGVMKGVIWSIAGDVPIADISHMIRPQDIAEAALVLARSAPYFPPGSIHVVVVDPGVGTDRRAIAARLGSHYFVCPDNGVLTLLLERVERENGPIHIVHLDKPRYWRPEVSHVFHGRDIFSPVAAHLARGVPLADLGSPIFDPVRLPPRRPTRLPGRLVGEIIHVDHFGNLSSNIYQEDLEGQLVIAVRLRGVEIRRLVKSFGERPPGELVALIGSTGNLIVAAVNDNAAARLGANAGDRMEVEFESPGEDG